MFVITFASTEEAMDASDTLAAASVRFRTMPTPLAISAGCGIALRLDGDDALVRRAWDALGRPRSAGITFHRACEGGFEPWMPQETSEDMAIG